MALTRTMTDISHPTHKLIKALKNKGYTNIRLTWHPATSRQRGFTVETEQLQYIKLGACVPTSMDIINQLGNIGEIVIKSNKDKPYLRLSKTRLINGQAYLLDVKPSQLTIKDCFLAFGFNEDGTDIKI